MSDLKKFINDSKQKHPEEFANFDEEYETFKLGILLKQARNEAGLTQEEVAKRLKTIENDKIINIRNGESCKGYSIVHSGKICICCRKTSVSCSEIVD